MSNARPRRLVAVAVLAAVALVVVAWAAATATAKSTAKRGTVVAVGSTAIGRILVDSRGRTLYLYTPDKKKTSSCYGQCAAFWPPLLTSAAPRAGRGAKKALLGTTKRKGGKLQVTYAGHPLYLFKKDKRRGDVNGQGFDKIWYAVSATGARVKKAVPPPKPPPAPPAATVQLGQTALGSILVDSRGRTLYMFTPDTATTSACYADCAANWPPLLANGDLTAAAGLQASLLGTIQRTDGATQVTYNGHPLYSFGGDTKPGDTNGQGYLSKWYALSAAGTPIGVS
jgi:predicted lipoprotein with Yx(FWY)xxD motif